MIKITFFSAGSCNVLFEVEPYRPANIHEPKLGTAIVRSNPNYCIEEGKFHRVVNGISVDESIMDLHKRREDAQKEFSQKIHKLKCKLDEFKLLKELTKKEIKK